MPAASQLGWSQTKTASSSMGLSTGELTQPSPSPSPSSSSSRGFLSPSTAQVSQSIQQPVFLSGSRKSKVPDSLRHLDRRVLQHPLISDRTNAEAKGQASGPKVLGLHPNSAAPAVRLWMRPFSSLSLGLSLLPVMGESVAHHGIGGAGEERGDLQELAILT